MASDGRPPKIITKEQVLRAMRHTKSNMAAARYLKVSYQHYKKYAKLYKDEEQDKTLFEIHFNQSGKGIRKHMGGYGKSKDTTPLQDVLDGKASIVDYTPDILKTRLIQEGFIEEKCNCCGFAERRVVDYKVPLLLNFLDKNKFNWVRENLEFLCYNCYFLQVGNVWSDSQLAQLEDYTVDNKYKQDEAPDFELDESSIQHLKELGLWDNEDEEGDEFLDFN